MSWVQEVIRDRVPDLLNLPGKVITKLTNNNIRGKIAHWRRQFRIRLAEVGLKLKQRIQDVGLHFRRLNKREVQVVDALLKGDRASLRNVAAFTAAGDPVKTKELADNLLAVLGDKDLKKQLIEISNGADVRIQDDIALKASRREMALKATRDRNIQVLEEERTFILNNPRWTEDWDIHNVVHGHEDLTDGVVHFFKAEAEEVMRRQQPPVDYLNREQYDAILYNSILKAFGQMNSHAEDILADEKRRTEAAQEGKSPITPHKYQQLRNAAVFKGLDLLLLLQRDAKERGHFMDVYRVALGIPSSVRDFGDRDGDEIKKFWSGITGDPAAVSNAAASAKPAEQTAALAKLQGVDSATVTPKQRPVPKPRSRPTPRPTPRPRKNPPTSAGSR